MDTKGNAITHPEVRELRRLHCLRCAHSWFPEPKTVGLPRICPKCKSLNWNKPKTVSRADPEGWTRSERAFVMFVLKYRETVHPEIVKRTLRLMEAEIELAQSYAAIAGAAPPRPAEAVGGTVEPAQRPARSRKPRRGAGE